MQTVRALVVVTCVGFMVGPARAQEVPDAPAGSAEEGAPWAAYHAAVLLLAGGDRDGARSALGRVVTDYPEHPVARHARELLTRMEDASGLTAEIPASYTRDSEVPQLVPLVQSPSTELGPEGPTGLARAEVVSVQTAHGIALGLEMCAAAECKDEKAWVLSAMVGAGAGLGLSLALTSGGVRAGEAAAWNSGVFWGAWTSILLLWETDGFDSSAATGLGLALGQLGGLGLDALLYEYLEPTGGQVALTSSGGVWTTYLTFLMTAAIADDAPDHLPLLLLGAGGAGLLGGALLAREVPMSRGRSLVIDAGGVLGTLTGAGLAVLAEADERPALLLVATGAAAGLGVSFALTSGWDAPSPGVHASLVPIERGAFASVAVDL